MEGRVWGRKLRCCVSIRRAQDNIPGRGMSLKMEDATALFMPSSRLLASALLRLELMTVVVVFVNRAKPNGGEGCEQ